MSKYDKLWGAVSASQKQSLCMTFEEIQALLGFPPDHSFLTYKKELLSFGYRVGRISMKNQTVYFERVK